MKHYKKFYGIVTKFCGQYTLLNRGDIFCWGRALLSYILQNGIFTFSTNRHPLKIDQHLHADDVYESYQGKTEAKNGVGW